MHLFALQSLCQFCTRVLQEMDIVITDIDTQVRFLKIPCSRMNIPFQFQNGVNLILMIGILEGYFVPFSQWHYTPKNHEQRASSTVVKKLGQCIVLFLQLDNVKLAFNLLADLGLVQDRAKPEGVLSLRPVLSW